MSKELTLKIMKMYGLLTSPQEVIAFISEASLTPEEEKDLKGAINSLSIGDDVVLKNLSDLNKFCGEHEEVLNVPAEKVAMYLRELPDKLDAKKSVEGYQNLLKIVPIEFLNKFTLAYLIRNTMSQDFWQKRITSPDNKRLFSDKFGITLAAILPEFGSAPVSLEDAKRAYESAITPEDKILSLRYLVNLKSDGHFGQEYFNENLSELPVAEQIEHLEKDYQFLDFQENAEASSKHSDYAYYSLNAAGDIISGWTYKKDAQDDKKESDQEDRGEWKVVKIVHHSRVNKDKLEAFNKKSGFKGNKPPEAE